MAVGLGHVAAAQDAAEQLHGLFEDHHQWQLSEFPAMAMARGDYSRADRVADASLEAIERRHERTKRYLHRREALGLKLKNQRVSKYRAHLR